MGLIEPVRRPRLDDVAAEVGVSTATVSLVLRGIAGPSPATRERVLGAAARLGYRPDRAASVLASKRSRLLGVVVDVSNPFHSELIEDVHEAAQRHGYNLILSAVTRTQDENRAIETLLDSRCAALALLGSKLPAERLAELAAHLPIVVVGRPVSSAGVDVVRTDDNEGLDQAVAYLAGLGHRQITYVGGGKGEVPTLRRKAYKRAMHRHHLGDQIRVLHGGETEDAGGRAAPDLLQLTPQATAVLTFNDRCAMGLIDALVRAGVQIPNSLSVIGYDDSTVARLGHINLTTISQNSPQLTEHAVTAMIERLDDTRSEQRVVVVPPHLVVRGTTGPPPTQQTLPTSGQLIEDRKRIGA
jgi:DNA-binding LacI/PurR family transcriptional regulator